MTSYVALLRAINAGVKLPMADLRAIAERLGHSRVSTYIASGNLLFRSAADEATVKAGLAAAVAAHVGAPVGLTIRTAAELAQALVANPFPEGPGNRVLAVFLDAPPPPDFPSTVRRRGPGEQVRAVGREIWVWYNEGMGKSKLTFPQLATGTARNVNTIARLAALAG